MGLNKNLLCAVYFAFAIAGAIFPTLSNIEFAREFGPGFNVGLFIDLANSNPAAESLSRDLFISSSVIFIWIINESRRLKMKNIWIVVLSTFTIAFAFSAPLFLFLRERRLIELDQEASMSG